MKIPTTAPLFAWHQLDDEPDLKALKQILDQVNDRDLLVALRRQRGKGRDDYPVAILWRTLLASFALRQPTMDAMLAEMSRNEGLRRVIGLGLGDPVPKAWNMSRFSKALGTPALLGQMQRIFAAHVSELSEHVRDLGAHTAGDSTHISVRHEEETPAVEHRADTKQRTFTRNKPGPKAKVEPTLPQPTGGKKEYVDEEGKVTQVLSWWGYKVHVVVDVKHEVALSFGITSANGADCEQVIPTLDKARHSLPHDRMRTHAYDKAGDDRKVHEALAERRIKPLIQLRALPNGGTMEKVLLGRGQVPTPFVHDEAGTVYCYDTVSDPPIKHLASYAGHDASRGTLKYRCPAAVEQWRCPSWKRCNRDSEYGRSLRIPCKTDFRRFPPIPRATKTFEEMYKGRTAAERAFARLKLLWGLDDGNLVGAGRFHAQVHAVMLVHISIARLLATAPRYEGKALSPTRLSPIAKALNQRTLEHAEHLAV